MGWENKIPDKVNDSIENIDVIKSDNVLKVYLQSCTNPASKQIALLNIIRLQSNSDKLNTQAVEVIVGDTDIRYFRVPEHIDDGVLSATILKDKILNHFEQASEYKKGKSSKGNINKYSNLSFL